MAEIKKIATRDSYGNALKELGAEFDNLVVLDADLAGATKTATFLKAFPDRHFDAGIAEANMVCMAAGMSTVGLVPFASSFAMFAAGRAFEQIRNSVGYPHLNVKIGATHGGISVGEDGASHQCCEDFGLMRTIPGMVVMSPYPIVDKLVAFGFDVQAIDGHNFDEIEAAFAHARTVTGKPSAIVIKSVKGKGVSFMENNAGWHGKAPNDAEYAQAMAELKAQLAELEA